MAFEKEKDAILSILYAKDKEIRSKSSLKQSVAKLKYGVSRDELLSSINSEDHSINMAIKALYGSYITQSINSGGWGEGEDIYMITDSGREFVEDKKSFVKERKSANFQHQLLFIKNISSPIISAIAVIIAGLSYWNESSNSNEIRQKLQANVQIINERLDSVVFQLNSIRLRSNSNENTPKYRQQNAKEKQADSINSEISSIATND